MEGETFCRKIQRLCATKKKLFLSPLRELVFTLQVNSFVGAFHDAVILYALALNDTLTEGEDPRNGTAVTRRMWNRTFKGTKPFHPYVLILRIIR